MELKICHMYPDVLNLYGDRGNVICMRSRLERRGIDCAVTRLPIGSAASLAGFDLVFIGGGQDFEQQVLLDDLHRGKAQEIRAAIADGVTFLTICGGYQMLGSYYETYDGQRCDFIGALDLYTVGSKTRMIGNYKFKCGEAAGGSVVVGFENHSGKTHLGRGVEPLGTVLAGFGNNGEDGTEGAHYKTCSAHTATAPCCRRTPNSATCCLLPRLSTATGKRSLPRSTIRLSFSRTTRCARG